MNQGIFFAALTIFFFGSWAVPTKTLKIDPQVQAFWLTIGHFLLSSVIFIFFARPLSLNDIVAPFIAGILWAIGITAGYIGIKHLGITRALGIWVPIVLITSALWGLVFFKEGSSLGNLQLIQTMLGLFLLVGAALAVIMSSRGENKLGNVKTGIIASVVIGIIHGSFFVPLRASALPIYVTFLPLTVGMVITTSLIVFLRKLKIKYDKKSTLRMLSAGFILGGGNYTALLTTQFLGVAQGYPLTQLGIIVNTLWGTLVFKETATRRGKILIAIGITVALLGAILLNSART